MAEPFPESCADSSGKMGFRHSQGGSADEAVQAHVHAGQYQDDHDHTDDGASGHKITEGSDHVDAGDEAYAEGCGEETQCTDDDGFHTGLQCDAGGFFLTVTVLTLLAESGGHQDCIVHSGTQLDGTDDHGSDEGDHGSGVGGQAHVDEDGELDDAHQDHRQGQAP